MSKSTFQPKDAQTSVVAPVADDGQMTVLQKISTVWTFISAGYAIASTCSFIARGWVDSVYAYVLIPLLVVFVIVFIALIAMSIKHPQNAKSNVKTYKKVLGIFKACANIFLLALGIVSMVGIATNKPDIERWIVVAITLVVALVQLAIKIAMFVERCRKKSVSHKFKVEVSSFKDGKMRRKSLVDNIKESGYKNK